MLSIPKSWASRQMAKKATLGLAVVILFCLLYFWRLGSIVPGLSPHEYAARMSSSTLGKIIENPLNAPHKVPQFILQLLGFHGAFWMRSISAVFGLIFIASCYLLLRTLFGKFIAVGATLMFAATPWVILISRNASADVMFLSPLLLLLVFAVLRKTENHHTLFWFLLIAALVICIYTPGLIWLLAITSLIGLKKIVKTISSLENFVMVLGIIILLVLISPLIYALTQDLAVLKEWLALPNHFSSVTSVFNYAARASSSLSYQMYFFQDYSVGKFAILSITQTALAILGILAMVKSMRRILIICLSLLILGIVFSALNKKLTYLGICLPAIALLDAAGLRYLTGKWFSVFPLNPLARTFALILITLLLLGQLAFGMRYALLAWPHNLETRKVYVIK
jgi:4-amino-4-deoxy-L-arabinose transferase-like glycosyltransferase